MEKVPDKMELRPPIAIFKPKHGQLRTGISISDVGSGWDKLKAVKMIFAINLGYYTWRL